MPVWRVGETVRNRWQVQRVLAGGMGIVYIVHDFQGHALAVKTFQDELFARHPDVAWRFQQEAHAWIGLDRHQNVTHARFLEDVDGKPHLLLEYVEGGDLGRWIGTPRLTEGFPLVLRLAMQFCDGMVHAASRGIVAHRDIKPQNCLLGGEEDLKITDFGLAKVFDGAGTGPDCPPPERRGGLFSRLFAGRGDRGRAGPPEPCIQRLGIGLTRTGAAAGTCSHMAPEQFEDARSVDVRADLYSFGVMLFQMASGGLPFKGRSFEEFRHLHGTRCPPPLSLSPAVPKGIVDRFTEIVHTCLAKDPSRRFASFGVLRCQLAEVYEELTGQSAPVSASGAMLDANDRVVKGSNLMKLGRPEEAIACFDEVLRLDPSYRVAWQGKGGVLLAQGRYEEALACFDRALALDPDSAVDWQNKGVALATAGRSPEAMECFQKASQLGSSDALHVARWMLGGTLESGDALLRYRRHLGLDTSRATELVYQGHALSRSGSHQEASRCYDDSLALDPDDPEALSGLAVTLAAQGSYQEALSCFDRVLALRPHDAKAWAAKGLLLGELGRSEEVVSCFDRALGLQPEDPWMWRSKGAELMGLGRPQEALACFERVLNLTPESAGAWVDKGWALADMERFEEAQACFDRGLALDPGHARGWINKGASLAMSGRPEALECFRKAQQLGHPEAARLAATFGGASERQAADRVGPAAAAPVPGGPDGAPGSGVAHQEALVWARKAAALARTERVEEALECLERALSLDPDNGEIWTTQGVALLQSGRPAEALASLDRARALDPDSAGTLQMKGLALQGLDRLEEAVASFEAALALVPEAAEVWRLKGRALVRLGRVQEGLACWERALRLDPSDCALWFGTGLGFATLGRIPEALRYLTEAQRRGHPRATQAIAACRLMPRPGR